MTILGLCFLNICMINFRKMNVISGKQLLTGSSELLTYGSNWNNSFHQYQCD